MLFIDWATVPSQKKKVNPPKKLANTSQNCKVSIYSRFYKLGYTLEFNIFLILSFLGPPLNITIEMSVVHLGKVREIDMVRVAIKTRCNLCLSLSAQTKPINAALA